MKTICIDIDGTICQYLEWVSPYHFGKVLPGAKETINKLHNDGWYIIIFSTIFTILSYYLYMNTYERHLLFNILKKLGL